MRIIREQTLKENCDEIVAAYLTGDNSYEELADYYKVGVKKLRIWGSHYRK